MISLLKRAGQDYSAKMNVEETGFAEPVRMVRKSASPFVVQIATRGGVSTTRRFPSMRA